MSLLTFDEYFCTITVLSLYGDYVLRFFLAEICVFYLVTLACKNKVLRCNTPRRTII